jgi:hypothetical protein
VLLTGFIAMDEDHELFQMAESGDPTEIQAAIAADPTCVKKLVL